MPWVTTNPGTDLATIHTRVRTIRRATPAITTEYHLKFVNIAFLSRLLRLVIPNGRPTVTSHQNFSQHTSGMHLGFCGLVDYGEGALKMD